MTALEAIPPSAPKGPISTTQPASKNFAFAFEDATRRVFSAYTVDLTSLAGCAGNGVQTYRHVLLVPKSGPPLVIGWVNPSAGIAELRTLGYTLALSKRRFGRELTIPPLEYLRFVEVAKKLLEERGMVVSVMAHPKTDLADIETTPPPRASTLPYLGMIAASASTLGFIASQIVR